MCHFVVWTKKSWEIIQVPRNPGYAFTLLTVIDYYFSHVIFYLLNGSIVPPLPTLREAKKAAATSGTQQQQQPPSVDPVRREVRKFVQAAARGKKQLVLQASSPVPVQDSSPLRASNGSPDRERQAAVLCQNISVPQQKPTSKIPRLKRAHEKKPEAVSNRGGAHIPNQRHSAAGSAAELSPLLSQVQLSPTLSPALKRFKDQVTYSKRVPAALPKAVAQEVSTTSSPVLRKLSVAAKVRFLFLLCLSEHLI
jgi:hypothetical protein